MKICYPVSPVKVFVESEITFGLKLLPLLLCLMGVLFVLSDCVEQDEISSNMGKNFVINVMLNKMAMLYAGFVNILCLNLVYNSGNKYYEQITLACVATSLHCPFILIHILV